MKYINEKRWKTMILVDKNIKERSTEIFVKNYNEASVNAISYDLHIKEIVGNLGLVQSSRLGNDVLCLIAFVHKVQSCIIAGFYADSKAGVA